MLACAFLPFLPLIVDAHIRQLEDDDFARRTASAAFLDGILRDTDGYRNYGEFLQVKWARESKNSRIKAATTLLYERHKEKHIRNQPFLMFLFDAEELPKTKQEAWQYIRTTLGDVFLRAEYWTITTPGYYRVCFRTRDLSAEQIHTLVGVVKQRREPSGRNDVGIVGIEDSHARALRVSFPVIYPATDYRGSRALTR
jgi:hypothetical protein